MKQIAQVNAQLPVQVVAQVVQVAAREAAIPDVQVVLAVALLHVQAAVKGALPHV